MAIRSEVWRVRAGYPVATHMIEAIRERFRRLEYEYSLHALDQSIHRRISTNEVEEAVSAGEVIEDYPADK